MTALVLAGTGLGGISGFEAETGRVLAAPADLAWPESAACLIDAMPIRQFGGAPGPGRGDGLTSPLPIAVGIGRPRVLTPVIDVIFPS